MALSAQQAPLTRPSMVTCCRAGRGAGRERAAGSVTEKTTRPHTQCTHRTGNVTRSPVSAQVRIAQRPAHLCRVGGQQAAVDCIRQVGCAAQRRRHAQASPVHHPLLRRGQLKVHGAQLVQLGTEGGRQKGGRRRRVAGGREAGEAARW